MNETNWLGNLLNGLAAAIPSEVQLLLAVVVAIVTVYYIWSQYQLTRQTVGNSEEVDEEENSTTVLGIAALLGGATGILWALINPIPIVPPFIHLRLFAFLPPVIGLIFGWRAGFVSGYVASWIWALMAGMFVPLHTPFADGIMVGLTGALPALLLRGNLSLAQLKAEIESNPRNWYVKSGIVCGVTGLLMSAVVALSLQLTAGLPFVVGFVAIGVISDTLPMIIVTGAFVRVVAGHRRLQSWAPQA